MKPEAANDGHSLKRYPRANQFVAASARANWGTMKSSFVLSPSAITALPQLGQVTMPF